MTPIAGYAPDADPTTPGVIVDCVNMVPTLRGMAGAPSPVAPLGVGALSSDARGAGVTTNTAGARRIFVGTQTALMELAGGTWTDRSKSGGYVGGPESRWSLAQFGDYTIASNGVDTMQASSTAAFANITEAPKAKIVVSAANFVLAFNTSESTYGVQGDRWWCSAFQDHTHWTPSLSTQATTGRLIGDGGEITAAVRMGEQVVAFKKTSIHVGTYVGTPVVWQWAQVPGEIGCVGPEAAADLGGACMFVGHSNIWLFDGSTRPVPVSEGSVRQWFFDNCSPKYRYRTIVHADKQNGRVWIFFPGNTSTTGQPDRCLVYHLGRKEWGRADIAAQCALNSVTPSVSFDTVPGTFDALPNVAFDSQYWLDGGVVPAVVNGSRQLVALVGAAGASSFTTGDLGDDDAATMLRRARLRFLRKPGTATAQGFTKSGEGEALTAVGSASMNDSGFDLRQSARWHRLRFSFTGDVEVTGLRVDTVPAGAR